MLNEDESPEEEVDDDTPEEERNIESNVGRHDALSLKTRQMSLATMVGTRRWRGMGRALSWRWKVSEYYLKAGRVAWSRIWNGP